MDCDDVLSVFCFHILTSVALETLAAGVQESSAHKAVRCWYVPWGILGAVPARLEVLGILDTLKYQQVNPEYISSAIVPTPGQVTAGKPLKLPGPPAPSVLLISLGPGSCCWWYTPLSPRGDHLTVVPLCLPSWPSAGLSGAHSCQLLPPAPGLLLRPTVVLALPHWLSLSLALELHMDTLNWMLGCPGSLHSNVRGQPGSWLSSCEIQRISQHFLLFVLLW